MVAKRMRNGTSLENIFSVVRVSKRAPINPPRMLTSRKRDNNGLTGARCRR